jgi:hypothetical protein
MFIKINNKQSVSYIALSSIIRVTFNNGEDVKPSCDIITSELTSGTTHNYDNKSTQTTSSSKSTRVFRETNEETYLKVLEYVGGEAPKPTKVKAVKTEEGEAVKKPSAKKSLTK